MEPRILECINGKASTEYILPFLWQHGEEYSLVEEEINAIQASGIQEFCVESRTHEQFGEEKWCVDNIKRYHALELSDVGEIAQLWLNDVYCGAVVNKPYRFVLDGKLREGKNQLRIEVMSNPAYREKDEFSTYLPLPPVGLTGRVYVEGFNGVE